MNYLLLIFAASYIFIEAENAIADLHKRCSNCEKAKQRLAAEMEDLQMELDRSYQKSIQLEKQAQNLERVNGEWKAKADKLRVELESCRRDDV